ncbi:hypothetical protein ACO0QE_002685 [Hanseniaspora vineae]
MTIEDAISYDSFFFSSDLKVFDANVSINHWQLRDLVKGSSLVPYKINYVFQNKIKSFDSNISQSKHSHRGSRNFKRHHPQQNHHHHHHHHHSDYNASTVCSNDVVLNYKPKCFQEIDEFYVTAGIIESQNGQDFAELCSDELPGNMEISNLDNFNTDRGKWSSDWRGVLSFKHGDASAALHQSALEDTPETPKVSNVTLGKLINNDIALYSADRAYTGVSQCEMFVCNNDQNLYHLNYDLRNGNLQMLNVINDMHTPLNSCNLAHDGSKMIVSGDSNKFALYSHNINTKEINAQNKNDRSGTFYQMGNLAQHELELDEISKIDYNLNFEKTYTAEYGEYGFSSCFNESNTQFTSVFQNGYGLVYDVRRLDKPIKHLVSSRPCTQKGAFRVCKYSGDIDNLLFISENVGVVHVLDSKNFDNHYLVELPNIIYSQPSASVCAEEADSSGFNNENIYYTQSSQTHSNESMSASYPLELGFGMQVSTPPRITTTSYDYESVDSMSANPNVTYLANAKESIQYQNFFKPNLTIFDNDTLFDSFKETFSTYYYYNTVFESSRARSTYRASHMDNDQIKEQNEFTSNENNDPTGFKESLELCHIHTLHPEAKQGEERSYQKANHDKNKFTRSVHTNKSRTRSRNLRFDTSDNHSLPEHMQFSQLLLRESGLGSSSPASFSSYGTQTPSLSSVSSTSLSRYQLPIANIINFETQNALLNDPNEYATTLDPAHAHTKSKENDISGLDWVQDNEGTSLVIGTSLGIYKWGIKSSLRNSLSTYDFL